MRLQEVHTVKCGPLKLLAISYNQWLMVLLFVSHQYVASSLCVSKHLVILCATYESWLHLTERLFAHIC